MILWITLPIAGALGWWLRGDGDGDRQGHAGSGDPRFDPLTARWVGWWSDPGSGRALSLVELEADPANALRACEVLDARFGFEEPRRWWRASLYRFAEGDDGLLPERLRYRFVANGRELEARPLIAAELGEQPAAVRLLARTLEAGATPLAAGTRRSFLVSIPAAGTAGWEELRLDRVEGPRWVFGEDELPLEVRRVAEATWRRFLERPVLEGPAGIAPEEPRTAATANGRAGGH